jgi:hypothetical protein
MKWQRWFTDTVVTNFPITSVALGASPAAPQMTEYAGDVHGNGDRRRDKQGI